jgi:hypothetical protein
MQFSSDYKTVLLRKSYAEAVTACAIIAQLEEGSFEGCAPSEK